MPSSAPDPVGTIVREHGAIPVQDILGPAEVRQLAGGVTARSLKLWREGTNLSGRGPFPAPFRELEIGALWDRRAVQEWLERKGT